MQPAEDLSGRDASIRGQLVSTSVWRKPPRQGASVPRAAHENAPDSVKSWGAFVTGITSAQRSPQTLNRCLRLPDLGLGQMDAVWFRRSFAVVKITLRELAQGTEGPRSTPPGKGVLDRVKNGAACFSK
jgi:hypothetical protein